MPPRQILVRCVVANRHGDMSTRYIPASEFGLWQYVMVNRHHIEVVRAAVGLWVADAELQRNERYIDRTDAGATRLQEVDRVDLSLYDEALGMCHLVRRFAARADTPQLIARLLQRLADTQPEHETSNGHFVGAKEVPDLRRLSRPLAALTGGIVGAVVALARATPIA